MAIVRCQACAAPLEPEQGARLVTCGYCNATTDLTRVVAAGARVAGSTTRGSRAGLGIALTSVAGLAVAGATAFLMNGGSPSLGFGEWYGFACLVDYNGDQALDVLGRTGGPGSESHALTVLDGKTGAKLWASDSIYGHETPVFCLGPDHFAVAHPDFRLELWDPKGTQPASVLRLPDTVMGWGRDEGCASFKTAEGEVVVDLATGKAGECATAPAAEQSIHDAPGFFGRKGASVEHKGTTYTVTAKAKGTPLLAVTAMRGGEVSWETKLPILRADSSGLNLAVSDDAVFTYGVKPGDKDYGIVTALEVTDGRVRFEARQSSHWSTNFARTFVLNGQHLIMTWGFGVHAYDTQTGQRVWNLGGR